MTTRDRTEGRWDSRGGNVSTARAQCEAKRRRRTPTPSRARDHLTRHGARFDARMLAFGLTAARARTAATVAHVCSFGLSFHPFLGVTMCHHFVSKMPGLAACDLRFFVRLRAFSCSFVRFCVFRAVLKLEPLTFNPSVLGSNPRGPTTRYHLRPRLRPRFASLSLRPVRIMPTARIWPAKRLNPKRFR